MKTINEGKHIIVKFTKQEKKSGLTDFLEPKLPVIGTQFSEDKLHLKVYAIHKEKFLKLVKKFEAEDSQLSLF